MSDFDLTAYLGRIGYDGDRAAGRTTLDELHLRHLDRIPFENVEVFLGRPGPLDVESLQSRLVHRRRGGYCFEQNTLFACALRALGFRVETLEARVRPPGAAATLPRTHMLLRVDLDGEALLADVGFGGDGPLLPVPLDGTRVEQPAGAYRVAAESDGVHALRQCRGGTWSDLYAFRLTPAYPVDFEVAHHFTSTHPQSVFVRNLTVQRSLQDVRHILRGRSYTLRHGADDTVSRISDAELEPLLREVFALELSTDDLARIRERLEPE